MQSSILSLQMCWHYEIHPFKMSLDVVKQSYGNERNSVNQDLLLEKPGMRIMQDTIPKLCETSRREHTRYITSNRII